MTKPSTVPYAYESGLIARLLGVVIEAVNSYGVKVIACMKNRACHSHLSIACTVNKVYSKAVNTVCHLSCAYVSVSSMSCTLHRAPRRRGTALDTEYTVVDSCIGHRIMVLSWGGGGSVWLWVGASFSLVSVVDRGQSSKVTRHNRNYLVPRAET
jgi:hypothetical protein